MSASHAQVEIADLEVFFPSPASSYSTGGLSTADGGFSLARHRPLLTPASGAGNSVMIGLTRKQGPRRKADPPGHVQIRIA